MVFNKLTNEPHLYSRTIRRDDGYECTPPDIMVVTEAYKSVYEKSMQNSNQELRKIENGKEKRESIISWEIVSSLMGRRELISYLERLLFPGSSLCRNRIIQVWMK